MQAILELFNNKNEIINNVKEKTKKSNKPKLNQNVERILFYSMASFLVVYLYAQYI